MALRCLTLSYQKTGRIVRIIICRDCSYLLEILVKRTHVAEQFHWVRVVWEVDITAWCRHWKYKIDKILHHILCLTPACTQCQPNISPPPLIKNAIKNFQLFCAGQFSKYPVKNIIFWNLNLYFIPEVTIRKVLTIVLQTGPQQETNGCFHKKQSIITFPISLRLVWGRRKKHCTRNYHELKHTWYYHD